MDEREDTQRDIEQGREPEGSQGILQDDPRAEERIGPPGRGKALGYQVYGLKDPRDGMFHYISCSMNAARSSRVLLRPSRKLGNSEIEEWVASLRMALLLPEMVILESGVDPESERGCVERWTYSLVRDGHPVISKKLRNSHFCGSKTATLEEYQARFWNKVSGDTTEGCWEWGGCKNRYGLFWYNGKLEPAHRVAYEWLVGKIPDGLELDHLCWNKICVNVNHLEPVTQAENVRRYAMRKTHCPQGHPYSGHNLIICSGHRICRECNYRRTTERREREKIALRPDFLPVNTI